jgi:hypothetical protein
MMSNRGLATGLFRAWGIMWAVTALVAVPQFVNSVLRNPYGSEQVGMRQYALSASAISLGCEVVIAIFLIAKAGWLAEIVFPVEEQAGFSFGRDDLQAVLFSAIGLYFLIIGLRAIAGGALAPWTRPRGVVVSNEYLWQKVPEQLVVGIVEAAAGTFVFFGKGRRTGRAGLYQKFFGLRGPPDE